MDSYVRTPTKCSLDRRRGRGRSRARRYCRHGFGLADPVDLGGRTYLNSVRGSWPADDDTLLMAGRGACRLLYTGSGTQGAIDGTAAQYGASPDQAAVVVRAARGTYCTQAPG